MKWRRCLGNVAHQSDHRPVCSIEHAWSTTEEGESHQQGGELHLARIGATSFSDRSYIFLRSELHLSWIGAFLTELTRKCWLSPLTGFGSCAPHLKVVWLDVWVQVDWNWFPDFVCSDTCSAAHQFVSTPSTLLGRKFEERPSWGFGKEQRNDLHQNRS